MQNMISRGNCKHWPAMRWTKLRHSFFYFFSLRHRPDLHYLPRTFGHDGNVGNGPEEALRSLRSFRYVWSKCSFKLFLMTNYDYFVNLKEE